MWIVGRQLFTELGPVGDGAIVGAPGLVDTQGGCGNGVPINR